MIRSEHEEIECFPLVLNARTFDELFEHNKSKIDCNDIQSGYFEYSEIRFGRASDYSEECFRRWDTRFRVENTHIITLTQPPGPQNASPSGRRVIFTPLSSDKQILDPISFNRVQRIGKLQKYPKYHCGMDAVKFALQRCEGAGFVTEYDKIASLWEAVNLQKHLVALLLVLASNVNKFECYSRQHFYEITSTQLIKSHSERLMFTHLKSVKHHYGICAFFNWT